MFSSSEITKQNDFLLSIPFCKNSVFLSSSDYNFNVQESRERDSDEKERNKEGRKNLSLHAHNRGVDCDKRGGVN
jgi:hypothetical protein